METIKTFKHNCMIIRVRPESIKIRGSLYEAVHRCWKAKKQNAEKADYVLALVGTIKNRDLKVQAVYKPERWYYPVSEGLCKEKKDECSKKYKVDPQQCQKNPRIGFEGKEMKNDTDYLHKLIPEKYYPFQNPVRYNYK